MTGFILSASVLIAAVLVLRLLFRGTISSRLRYALWGLVVLRLILPFPLIGSSFSVMNVIGTSEAAEASSGLQALNMIGGTAVSPAETVTGRIPFEIPDSVVTADSVVTPGSSDIVDSAPDMTPRVLRIVWLTGSVAVGLWFFVENRMFYVRLKKTRRYYTATDAGLPVYIAAGLASPCLFGVFRPCVYLTPGAVEEEGTARYVIAHERCHYRHGDHIWAALRGLCLAVWWWHPLVWAAAFFSRQDSELACDEAVLQELGEDSRLAYGRTLVGMITVKNEPAGLLRAATAMSCGKRGIKARLDRIIRRPKTFIPAAVAVLLLAAALAGCTFTSAQSGPDPSVPETSGSDPSASLTEEKPAVSSYAQALYDKRSPYIGDAPANGALLAEMGITEQLGSYTLELETQSEPYVLRLIFTDETTDAAALNAAMNDYAMLLLALIENVSEVQWQYKYFDKAADGHGEFTGALTAADATAALNGTDIKNFGKASADVQSLLDRMEGSRASENTVSQLTAAVDLTNLDAAVSDAILSENASHFPPGDLVAEAHTVLGTEENGGTTTVYAMAMYRVFGYAGSGFTNTGGSHSPVAITFDMNEAGEYVLSEYWMPGDGSDYGPSVRAKFPPELYTDALDTQKYVTAHIQACYAQAIEFGKVSVSGYLKQVLETICSSPSFSSNARDYIDAHPIAYRELIYYGQYTLDYCFALFEQGGQTGLSGHIMASACRDIIGAAASVDTPVTNGQEWYDTYKATVRQPTAAFSQYNNGDFLNSDDDIRYTDSALLKNDFDGDGNTDALSCHISRSESNDANNPTLVTLEFAPGQPVTDARDGSVSAGVVDFDTPVIYEDTRSGRVSVGVVDFNTDDPYLDIYIFSLGANSAASVATYRYDGKQLRAYLSFEITQDASFWYDTQGSIIYEGTYEGRSGISIMLDYISGQLTVID